jgi:tRNA nucleotidyltransferase (CCA-adding enzyme)
VQLVARSTSDYVDVGQIARHFNGGGHARASAALVNDGKRDQIYDQLIGILPKYVRPIAKVAEIMSREPQLLPPDTTAQEAAEQMQRYGYEGYPIVENDRVVGLLTRTQVDRALGHKMNLAVDQLMKAGDVVIQADASVEDLQKLMTETGWGQIPVVDPETGKIIGIVTRTDLLKTLEPRKTSSGPQSVSARLENAFPRMHLELLKMVAACADQQQAALYIVGGFVRDLLLERPSLDYDLVVEGDAIQLGKTLAGKYGGRLVTHGRFGTAKWQLQDARGKLQELFGGEDGSLPETLDLVSARREFYSRPTALPTVEPGGIKLDLHRRDFTINTMALRLDGKYYGDLYDYWGGLADLRKGLVRILHSLSFVDDPTRILRAVRFEKRFDFKIEERTLELLKAALPLLDRVSGDRLRHELDSIFAEEKCIAMLSRLFALNILPAVYSEVSWDAKVEGWMRLLPGLTGNDEWAISPSDLGGYSLETSLGYIFLFGRMNQKQIADINKRLKLPGSIAKTILSFASLRAEIDSLADAPPSTVFVRLQDIPKITLFAVYLTAENDKSRALLYTFITAWAKIKPTIDGHDLRARGLSPGPEYSKILERLRAAWLDEEISSPEEENALLEKLIHG